MSPLPSAPRGVPALADRPHTKIVATIGPASESCLPELVRAGLSVARINFSHGSAEEHRRRAAKIRAVARDLMTPVGILCDLQGPKMRLGQFENGWRTLREGETVRLAEGAGLAGPGEVLLNLQGLDAVAPGHRVILADGQVELVAQRVEADGRIVAEVRRGGKVGDRKGVHLPDSPVRYELPTPGDLEHIALAQELGADMLAVSFVALPEELRRIRALAPGLSLVAKIERAAALENLPGLLAECEGIMVARGDLGVEIDLEHLPMHQKSMIQDAHAAGKFAITATEMLESMVHSSRPTRAEVTDVANAVLDGTDALMLSAETAIGEYPVQSVATMARIARAVEESPRYDSMTRTTFREQERDFSNATALAAVRASEALGIDLIVCFTETGNTARLLSRYRPSARIVALTPNRATTGQMTVLAHVHPVLFRREQSLEEMLYVASEMLVVRDFAQYGDPIVFVAGVPPGITRTTNVMKLHRIGEDVRLH